MGPYSAPSARAQGEVTLRDGEYVTDTDVRLPFEGAGGTRAAHVLRSLPLWLADSHVKNNIH